MTEGLVVVEPSDDNDNVGIGVEVAAGSGVDELEVARELVRRAWESGVSLNGPDRLLTAITTTMLETALDEGRTLRASRL